MATLTASSDPSVIGDDRSDSTFTIQSSVAPLNLAASIIDGGVELTWSREPGVGPEGLAGYRLYRIAVKVRLSRTGAP